eukprot:973591-Prymnesium_polylepis.2
MKCKTAQTIRADLHSSIVERHWTGIHVHSQTGWLELGLVLALAIESLIAKKGKREIEPRASSWRGRRGR